MKNTSITIEEVLSRQVAEVLPNREALGRLMKERKIRLYLGVDPTGRNLHLGHAIALRKLQQFADLGHEAILVVGTGTVLAGDPSQRASARERIDEKTVKENIKTWKSQVSKIIDFSRVKIKTNGDWLLKLKLPEILNIASHVSASQLMQRDMFQERLRRGDTVWTNEFLYPLLQGYDSVAMDVDLEIGGTDQVFNMLVGRELQKKMKNREKYVLTTQMILGLDGKPMSKTSGNTINIADEPQDMYGKVMSIHDDLIQHYFELCTDIPLDDIGNMEPREAKGRLAKEIVRLYHGEKAASVAEEDFQRMFQKKEMPSEIPEVSIAEENFQLGELLVKIGFASSKSDARRLVDQGGVSVDDVLQDDVGKEVSVRRGMVIKVGKRRFVRVV